MCRRIMLNLYNQNEYQMRCDPSKNDVWMIVGCSEIMEAAGISVNQALEIMRLS